VLLLAAGSVLEIGAGLCLALGIGVPYAAAALAVFTIAATLMLLDLSRPWLAIAHSASTTAKTALSSTWFSKG
jgi:uncharacterized membrane protein YphA (DoxX/SURF4 family)